MRTASPGDDERAWDYWTWVAVDVSVGLRAMFYGVHPSRNLDLGVKCGARRDDCPC